VKWREVSFAEAIAFSVTRVADCTRADACGRFDLTTWFADGSAIGASSEFDYRDGPELTPYAKPPRFWIGTP